jgi:hypothetical protein
MKSLLDISLLWINDVLFVPNSLHSTLFIVSSDEERLGGNKKELNRFPIMKAKR